MPGIPQETIDRVLESTDIVELIGSFIALKKLGQNFQGLCPFHEDKSPSLSVSPEKKIFRCFGCGTSGNAITFLRKHKNLPFPEAVRMLADKAKIPFETGYRQKAGAFSLLSCQSPGRIHESASLGRLPITGKLSDRARHQTRNPRGIWPWLRRLR